MGEEVFMCGVWICNLQFPSLLTTALGSLPSHSALGLSFSGSFYHQSELYLMEFHQQTREGAGKVRKGRRERPGR